MYISKFSSYSLKIVISLFISPMTMRRKVRKILKSAKELYHFFYSFQFIRDNYHAIRNQISRNLDIKHLEGNQIFVQNLSYLDLQHQNAIECQIAEEHLEAGTNDQMIQGDSLPLCFESCETFKEREEELVQTHEIPFQPICNELQETFQVLYDPIADRLDDESNHTFSPLTDHEGQNQDDNGFTRQTLQSVKISSQRAVENMLGDKGKSDI